MYYSLNKFHLSSRNLPGQDISPRKYKLMRWTGISEIDLCPYTKIGLYENEIYTISAGRHGLDLKCHMAVFYSSVAIGLHAL